ncbi:MAG TPA: dihydroneopterin aldolase [Acidimicrobiia bacterium]|nr:dihydroneopterin aldolase [Acidimicrobiia bacterium]
MVGRDSLVDRITITGIEVFAFHGVLPAEKEQGQRFLIDLDLALDLTQAGDSDDVADTIDYSWLAQQVHELVAGERWNLIEKVAERVARLVLDASPANEVTVSVHKPQAPISVPFADVAVTIVRPRNTLTRP